VSEDRIAFPVLRPFHRAMLEQIHESLRHDFPCLLTDNLDAVLQFRPRIVVTADELPQLVTSALPSALVIWTRHGFSHKRYVERFIKTCDIACVSSEWVRDDFERRGWRPRVGWWVTGFPAMDAALDPSRPRGLGSGNLEPGQTLLYAPTYNPLLSSADVLGPNWLDELASRFPSLGVVIKPHPVIPERNPEWMQMWRIAAARLGRVHLVEESHRNVYQLMPDADVLLTDASSVFCYWFAFDRPLVLVNNPRRFLDTERYDPEGPEWTWRDAGIEIESADELPDAIARCLQDPAEKAQLRDVYRRRVFGDVVEAGASERIAARVRLLLRPTRSERGAVKHTWRVVRWRVRRESFGAFVRRTGKRVRRSVGRLRRASRRLRPFNRAGTGG
jgi:hypothetical protein